MAKFCGKCGAKLDEQTGLCPNCGSDALKKLQERQADTSVKNNETAQPESTKEPFDKGRAKKTEKRAARKTKQPAMPPDRKAPHYFLKILALLLVLVLFAAGVMASLAYFGVINEPVINNLIALIKPKDGQPLPLSNDGSIPEDFEVVPPDAQIYYENNSIIVQEINAKDSETVPTESEVFSELTKRGFVDFSIATEYSMDGEYSNSTDISDQASTKHPTYETYYVSQGGDIWTIFVINGQIMANPVSYNMQSDLGVQLIISETDTVTSYDSATNRFFETLPKESALIVKTVDRIDAEKLEELTVEAIDEL